MLTYLCFCFCFYREEKKRKKKKRKEKLGLERDGEGEDCDKEDRQFDEQASDVFEAEERVVEEGEGAGDSLRRRGWSHDLLKHWQAL